MEPASVLDELRSLHPDTFKGWDDFEVTMSARDRKGNKCVLILLYNKGKQHVVDLHASFLITDDDQIRIGGEELVAEFNEAYVVKK